MKMAKLLVPGLLLLVSMGSKAQTGAQISDADLTKYAVTMDSIQGMQESLRDLVAEVVQTNTAMPVARYNELFKIANDEAKMKEANATPEEVKFLKEIDELRKVNIERINATYQALAKDYVGLKTFNVIRKSLQSDQQLKARYDNLSRDKEAKAKGG